MLCDLEIVNGPVNTHTWWGKSKREQGQSEDARSQKQRRPHNRVKSLAWGEFLAGAEFPETERKGTGFAIAALEGVSHRGGQRCGRGYLLSYVFSPSGIVSSKYGSRGLNDSRIRVERVDP